MRILVAEDDPVSRLLMKRTVLALGHECLVAKDGQEAWEIFQANKIDVLVTDWLMPGLNGIELCQRIRGVGGVDRGYTYIIMLTGLTEKHYFHSGMQAGADDYLAKPLDPEDLQFRLLVASRITNLHQLLADQKAELERLNRHLSEEIDVARRIQTALLPQNLAIEGHELAMEMRPAAQVGGDLIDYLPQPDGTFWLAVGDVTGHGLPAGLIMMMTQSILTSLVINQPAASPRELLIQLNRAIHQNVRDRLRNDNYLTLQLLRHTGDGRFVGAGLHCDMLIHRAATGQLERLETPGMWIGMLPEVDEYLQEYAFEMGPGDVLLLFSDGLIEAMNAHGEQYDMGRLEAALRRHAAMPAEALKRAILEEVYAWLHEQLDDISLIVLRQKDMPGASAIFGQSSS